MSLPDELDPTLRRTITDADRAIESAAIFDALFVQPYLRADEPEPDDEPDDLTGYLPVAWVAGLAFLSALAAGAAALGIGAVRVARWMRGAR